MKMPPLATFWTCAQVTCDVLRAVTILSSASFASCLAIMSCCDVCVEAMASPNTPNRLTSPTVSTAIEITTSISENPRSACLRTREYPLRPIIDVATDSLPPHCCRAANRESGPFRPTASPLGNSSNLPHARCPPRLHPSPTRQHLLPPPHPAPNRPGRSKSSALLRPPRSRYSQSQSPRAPFRSRPEPVWRRAPIPRRMTHPSAIDKPRYSARPEIPP